MRIHAHFHFLFLALPNLASATQHLVNVTIEHTDISVSYWPLEAWRLITNLEGADDELDLLLYPNCAPTTYHNARVTAETVLTDAERRSDSDWLSDYPMTLRLNFTGSAAYVFGILFPGMSASSIIDGEIHPIPLPNLACSPFTPIVSYFGLSDVEHELVIIVPRGSIFLFTHLIYTRPASLPSLSQPPQQEDEHPLKTHISRSSDAAEDISTHTGKHNIATFAAAIGGSVGALSTVALCVALNVIRRRRLAAQRDREEGSLGDDGGSHSGSGWRGRIGRRPSSLHTDASEDSPISVVGASQMYMVGPAPFVPRFFPGTVLPLSASMPPPLLFEHTLGLAPDDVDPPSYDSVAVSSTEVSGPAVVIPGERDSRSSAGDNNNMTGEPYGYADFPPPTPPPLNSADPEHFRGELLGQVSMSRPVSPPGLPPPFVGDDVQSSDDGCHPGSMIMGGSSPPLPPVRSERRQGPQLEGDVGGGCEGDLREQVVT